MRADPLSDLLRSVRLRGAVFYYVSCRDRWAAEAPAAREIADAVLPGAEHVMEYHLVARGRGWASVSGLPPVPLEAGDVVVFPQGDAHVMSSAPGVPPQRQEAEWVFSTRHVPKPMPIGFHHGVMEPGATLPVEGAETVLVCGFLGCDLRPFNPLVAALPRLLRVRAGDWVARMVDLAAAESRMPRPGGSAVLERLSEMVFVDAARGYLEQLPAPATGWLAALRDRHVGRALALMHERPEHPWTLEAIGREAGLSRSALHERFVQCLGQPPMHYLASWRIQRGAELLRDSDRTVATVALDVGYDSEAAFSRAFRRAVGMPPAAWRRAHADPDTAPGPP